MRRLENEARKIAKILDEGLMAVSKGERQGFALLLFSFDGPEMTWISNARREDMVQAMQEFIRRNPPDQTSEARN